MIRFDVWCITPITGGQGFLLLSIRVIIYYKLSQVDDKVHIDLNVKSNIEAWNIYGRNINALNINAKDIYACRLDVNDIKVHDISALSINANNISYYAVCYAYENIKCKSIKGRRHNSKHFALDGKIEVEEDD